MLTPLRLGQMLSRIRPVPLTGTWFRFSDLLFAINGLDPLSGTGSQYASGRFHIKGAFSCLYLAESPGIALSETIEGVIPISPKLILAVEAMLFRVLDLRDEQIQSSLQTSFQELTGIWRYRDGRPTPTQQLGQAVFDQGGFEAIRFPAAKSDSGSNLAVLKDRLDKDSQLRIYDPDDLLGKAKQKGLG